MERLPDRTHSALDRPRPAIKVTAGMKISTPAFLFVLALTVSCSRESDPGQPYVALAEKFAHALMAGRYEEAHGLLTEEQAKLLPAAALKQAYEGMVGHGPGRQIQVMQTLEAWPAKQRGDAGWVYVAITGDGFSEAVTVVVTGDGGRLAIRSIEWGRP